MKIAGFKFCFCASVLAHGLAFSTKVNAQGKAARVRLKQSSGFAALDEAAIEAVKTWEF